MITLVKISISTEFKKSLQMGKYSLTQDSARKEYFTDASNILEFRAANVGLHACQRLPFYVAPQNEHVGIIFYVLFMPAFSCLNSFIFKFNIY